MPILLGEADALFARGKYAQTAERLQEALSLDDRHAEAHASLGAVLCHLGRYGEAQSALRRATELQSSLAGAHSNLGTNARPTR